MKIAHLCLAAIYVEGFSYQENILPKLHKRMGHDVRIFASTETYLSTRELGYVDSGVSLNEHQILVQRIDYVKWIPRAIVKKLRIYSGLSTLLSEFEPDVIFLHDAQFWNIRDVVHYARKTSHVTIYSDCHTDFGNSARGFVSEFILHRLYYRYLISKLEPHVQRFYGVTPPRCTFLEEVYGVNSDKIEYLPLGYDDSDSSSVELRSKRNLTRESFRFSIDKFLICTGGKFDDRKRLDLLIDACNKLPPDVADNVEIVLFGEPPASQKRKFTSIVSLSKVKIHILGWLTPNQVSAVIASSDLMVFPGTHSTLWEESRGLGIPVVLRYWDGLDGLVDKTSPLTLFEASASSLCKIIIKAITDEDFYAQLAEEAVLDSSKFQYSLIAEKAISNIGS